MRLRTHAFLLLSAVAGACALAVGCNQNKLVHGAQVSPTPEPSGSPEYLGKEFFAADLDNIVDMSGSPPVDAAGAQFAVSVANPDASATAHVVIDNVAGTVTTADVAPGALQIFPLPRADVDGTTQVPNAYRITSDIPVMAHQFNPLGNVLVYSNDASLLLPTSALGGDYRAMSWEQTAANQLPGFVTIVAVEDGATNVSVTLSGSTQAGTGIPAQPAGATVTRTLAKYDELSFETDTMGDDLTGTAIHADKRIAVFGGAECADVPSGTTACDHLEEQLYPNGVWGKKYVAAKSRPRGNEPDVWRVMAGTDGTTITTDPLQPGTPVTLNAGKFVDIISKDSFVIQAGAPVLVGQYLVGQDYNLFDAGETGDPSMILSVPVEQYRSDYIFLTPPNYANNSVTIIAPTGVAVSVDGTPVASSSWAALGSSGWSRAWVDVAAGVHKVSAAQPISLEITGYDQYVSYGYMGGMNLVTLPN